MRNRSRLLAWLALLPLALNVFAGEFSKDAGVPSVPAVPVSGVEAPQIPALPVLPALEPASDVAASLAPVPEIPTAAEAVVAQPAAVAQAPISGSAVSQAAERLSQRFARQSDVLRQAAVSDPTGQATSRQLGAFFSGSRGARDSGAVSSSRDPRAQVKATNDEGMVVTGRTAAQYFEIKRLQALLEAKGVNLKESMDVMDGTYAEIRAKLTTVESVAKERAVAGSNTHLEKTLTWIDGLITDDSGRRTAVHTQRVFFHPAPNRQSEIAEGIRRVAKTLDQEKIQFAPGGAAEQALGAVDEVVLGFDSRGYDEIKQYIKSREAEFGPRYRFVFTDDISQTPQTVQAMRAEVRRLAAQFPDNQADLENIYDGVTYSRYVGLLFELKSIEYYINRGYKILESGRDFFSPDGQYKTEFDAVVKSPKGEIVIVEAKSARVPLSLVKSEGDKAAVDSNGMLDVMEEKFLYKLRMYQDDHQMIQDYVRKNYGEGSISVVFSTDPGGTLRKAARQGVLVWNNPQQAELKDHLDKVAPDLGREYGYPVSFLFLNSHPGEDPMLFYQKPMSMEEWSMRQATQSRKKGGNRRDRGNR